MAGVNLTSQQVRLWGGGGRYNPLNSPPPGSASEYISCDDPVVHTVVEVIMSENIVSAFHFSVRDCIQRDVDNYIYRMVPF